MSITQFHILKLAIHGSLVLTPQKHAPTAVSDAEVLEYHGPLKFRLSCFSPDLIGCYKERNGIAENLQSRHAGHR